jgi:hypothetical protein
MKESYIDKLPTFPKLSPNFTLEDIRIIRDYDAKLSDYLSPDEIQAYFTDAADNFEKKIQEKRAAGIKPVYPKRIEV